VAERNTTKFLAAARIGDVRQQLYFNLAHAAAPFAGDTGVEAVISIFEFDAMEQPASPTQSRASLLQVVSSCSRE
jgi:hypothetical protein